MPSKKSPRPRAEPGSLRDLQKELWHAVLCASRLLDSHDRNVRLRAVHGLSQVSRSYLKVLQVGDLEERILALEARAEKEKL